MRSVKMAVLVALAAFLCLPNSLTAQEEPQAQKHEDVTWYEIVHVDFEPGKTDDALELIKEHYIPAAGEAGNPGPEMVLQHQTGSWDLTLVWKLDRGPSVFEWETTPEGAAFQKALLEMVGEEKMQEISETYQSYIDRSELTITYQDPELLVEQ